MDRAGRRPWRGEHREGTRPCTTRERTRYRQTQPRCSLRRARMSTVPTPRRHGAWPVAFLASLPSTVPCCRGIILRRNGDDWGKQFTAPGQATLCVGRCVGWGRWSMPPCAARLHNLPNTVSHTHVSAEGCNRSTLPAAGWQVEIAPVRSAPVRHGTCLCRDCLMRLGAAPRAQPANGSVPVAAKAAVSEVQGGAGDCRVADQHPPPPPPPPPLFSPPPPPRPPGG